MKHRMDSFTIIWKSITEVLLSQLQQKICVAILEMKL